MNNTPPWIKRSRALSLLKVGRTNNNNYAIYNKEPWRSVSVQTRIDNPVCAMCGHEDHDYTHFMLDHIIPISQKGAIYDSRNHQVLCKHPCHDKKSGKDQKGYKGDYLTLDKGEDKGRRIPVNKNADRVGGQIDSD